MNLTETRRQNLRVWTAENGTPVAEKSYFSQLKGNGSFGEKVARRLEREYGMGDGYLDRPIVGDANRNTAAEAGTVAMTKPASSRKAPKKLPRADAPVNADVLAEMNVISAREAQLLNWFRMATEPSKGIIEEIARTIEKAPLASIADDEAQHRLSGARSSHRD